MEYFITWLLCMAFIIYKWGKLEGTADFAGILSMGLLIGTLLTLGYIYT